MPLFLRFYFHFLLAIRALSRRRLILFAPFLPLKRRRPLNNFLLGILHMGTGYSGCSRIARLSEGVGVRQPLRTPCILA